MNTMPTPTVSPPGCARNFDTPRYQASRPSPYRHLRMSQGHSPSNPLLQPLQPARSIALLGRQGKHRKAESRYRTRTLSRLCWSLHSPASAHTEKRRCQRRNFHWTRGLGAYTAEKYLVSNSAWCSSGLGNLRQARRCSRLWVRDQLLS